MIGKIVIVLVLIILIIFGVRYLSGSKSALPVSITEEDFTQITQGENQEFLRVLRSVENVSLNGSIFSSPVFQSLFDFGIDLNSEPVGRNNPFRPIDPIERSIAVSLLESTATEETLAQ